MQEFVTVPYWLDSAPMPSFPRLSRSLEVDVAVIGAGITGVTAAYLLKSAGLRVALVEREQAAMLDTGHTTAHLTYVTDTRLRELVKNFGAERAQAVWDGGRIAIEQIQRIVADERIACELRSTTGYLHAPLDGDEDEARDVLREDADLARQLGFNAAFVERVPYLDRAGVEFQDQAAFHPRRYLSGLIGLIPGEGSHVFEHTTVDDVGEEPLRVRAGPHSIWCTCVVMATHTPLTGASTLLGATLLQSKLTRYTSYAIGGRVRPGTLPEGLFWDTADPYHYLRIDPHQQFDYVIFGGEDHKTGQEPDTPRRFEALERTLRSVIPSTDITHRWSGQVVETNDGLPYIGETAPGQFAATGFAGNGMTFGTLGAMMARDAVLERPNPWRELFDVHRTKLFGGTWNYLKENKDYLYYVARDRFAAAQGKSLQALKPREGKVLELDGEPVAAYRDAQGVVFLRSAVCTHMGCLVAWNAAEATWDCPCHGSRFKPAGEVLAGPAESPLAEAEAHSAATSS